MLTELHVITGSILGFSAGIIIMIIASVVKRTKPERLKVPLKDSRLEKRAAPFIEIHNSLLDERDLANDQDAANRLREKIDSFKFRNRFYKE